MVETIVGTSSLVTATAKLEVTAVPSVHAGHTAGCGPDVGQISESANRNKQLTVNAQV